MSIDYNTSRDELGVREFGRNIQNMILKLKDIDDKEKRNRLAKSTVEIMAQMNPTQRYNDEYRTQLWELVYDIAGREIDIDAPVPPRKEGEKRFEKPERIPYPQEDNKYKHYGKNIMLLIAAARKMEEKDKKESITRIIASYMKIAHRNWNQKESSSEEIIIADLEQISGGELTISREELSRLGNQSLSSSSSSSSKSTPRKRPSGSNQNNYRRHNNNNNKRRPPRKY